jgi:parallel beta-helix repeat protein
MTHKIIFFIFLSIAGLSDVYGKASQDNIYDPKDYGAIPDGQTLSTEAIQKAIDECTENGGGMVKLNGGQFLTGTIFMKSNVRLEITEGSTLLGSTDLKHYPKTHSDFRSYTDNYTDKSLIYGEDLMNIAITGEGTIDGQGSYFKGDYKKRPYGIRFISCRNILIEDVSMRNSAMWMQHYLACDSVVIRGIEVWNHGNKNNDGIDIDGCHHVIIEDCEIDSDDDGICLKSSSERLCEDIVIRNCIVGSHCNAIKCGTESTGGFKDVIIQDCKIIPSDEVNVIYGIGSGLAGIALEIVDGGTMENVSVSGIHITGTTAPIFMRLGNRARLYRKGQKEPGVGTMENVSFSEIVSVGSRNTGCMIAGISGHPIKNLIFTNIKLTFEGGGVPEDGTRQFDEKPDQYPECTMFAERLPAYGFYFWHVNGLILKNVELITEKTDPRNSILFEEVSDILLNGKPFVY